jgi:protein-S-isoprenylcysteine O-methyltransferase Ste14
MRRTLLATDARRYPDSYASEHPLEELASIALALAVLLLLAALAFLVPPEQRDSLARWPALPRAALLVSIPAWIALCWRIFGESISVTT